MTKESIYFPDSADLYGPEAEPETPSPAQAADPEPTPAPEPVAKPVGLDLDEIGEFLTRVRAASITDPTALATTAITHFHRLVGLAEQLAAAVAHQTRKIHELLVTDLALVSMRPPEPAAVLPPPLQPQPGYSPPGGTGPQWPITPEMLMQMQQVSQAVRAQENQTQGQLQDPAYQAFLARQAQAQLAPDPALAYLPPQPQPAPPQYGPVRNGQVITPQHASTNLLEALSAPPPPIPSGFGGREADSRNFRVDRV